MSPEILRQLGCSGDEQEIALSFHVVREDKNYVWIFDVVDELGAELVLGSDWLSDAGQSILRKHEETAATIIEPVPISGKAAIDHRDVNPSFGSAFPRPASASPHTASAKHQVDGREPLDHRRKSDLTVSGPSHRPQSAPTLEKAENARTFLPRLLDLAMS